MIIKYTEQMQTVLDFIATNDKIAIDIETTGLSKHKDEIVGIGVSNATEGYYVPASTGFQQHLCNALIGKKLITWNGAFDLPFIAAKYGINLVPYLHCEAMLAKHTTDEIPPFKLKECAAKEFGIDAKKEQEEMKASVKANGGSAKEYFKADLEILGKYCIQDCILTFKLAELYEARMAEAGLLDFFYRDEVMPLYREVTIPMECNGMRLDMQKLSKAKTDIEADMLQLRASILSAIEPHLSKFKTWYLNKNYPMATFTGKVPAWQKKYKTQMEAFEAESTEPMFNIQSNVHLNKLFFDALEETPLSRTPTGKPQVNEDFLDHIAAKYSWAADLVVYNKLSKLNGTYIARFLDEAIDDIWYPDFKQHGTTSGRYSGDAQQLPRVIPPEDIEMHDSRVVKYTNMIRSFFIARPGHMLCSSDYNQLEPSVFAHVSGDVPLQKIFHEGLDFYSEVAIRTENLTGVSSHKKADNYLGKVSKTARQNAKAYALGLAYGMTGYKLKFTINTSEAEANNLVQQYYIAFPNLKALIDKSRYDAETKGFVISQAGRVRHLPDAKRIFEQYGEAIRDDLQLWKKYNGTSLYKQAKLDRKVYKNAVNNAMNFQIQGLAASIMNKAAIKLARVIKSEGLNTLILANVHDELILDVPESEINIVGPLVKQIMQDTTKLSVPLVVDPQFGNSYDQCK